MWIVRGGFPTKTMNVYLIEDDGGVTMFDAGISDMTAAVRAAGARLGGIQRVVLGHADADHRGTAPGIGRPRLLPPRRAGGRRVPDPCRPYWDLSQAPAPRPRSLLKRPMPVWDGGAVEIAGTVEEGDEVAGFQVIHLPGHAPGLIGLFRESDRLALVSDCFYTLDPQTGIKGRRRAFRTRRSTSTREQARDSIRKLAALQPAVVWPGHADPVTGDVVSELQRAAAASRRSVGRRARQQPDDCAPPVASRKPSRRARENSSR